MEHGLIRWEPFRALTIDRVGQDARPFRDEGVSAGAISMAVRFRRAAWLPKSRRKSIELIWRPR